MPIHVESTLKEVTNTIGSNETKHFMPQKSFQTKISQYHHIIQSPTPCDYPPQMVALPHLLNQCQNSGEPLSISKHFSLVSHFSCVAAWNPNPIIMVI